MTFSPGAKLPPTSVRVPPEATGLGDAVRVAVAREMVASSEAVRPLVPVAVKVTSPGAWVSGTGQS